MPAISDDDTGRMSGAESNTSEQFVKRKMSPSMANPKESSGRNQSRFNTVPDRRSGKDKNQKMISPNRMIQQKFLKLLTKGFKKSQQ